MKPKEKLHKDQKAILNYLEQGKSIRGMSLREIGRLFGIAHPQTVKHHISQLILHGFIDSTLKIK